MMKFAASFILLLATASEAKKCHFELSNSLSGEQTQTVSEALFPGSCADDADEIDFQFNVKKFTFKRSIASANGKHGVFHGESGFNSFNFRLVPGYDDKISGTIVDVDDDLIHSFWVNDQGHQMITSTPGHEYDEEGEYDDDDHQDFLTEEEEDNNRQLFDKKSLRGSQPKPAVRNLSGNVVIDVMVPWTKAAECKRSGRAIDCEVTPTTRNNMLTLIADAIEETNEAFEFSGINAEVQLVHAYREGNYYEGDYVDLSVRESGMRKALGHLRSTTDGILDNVHYKRAMYGADIVVMIMHDERYCGYAGVDTSAARSFAVVKQNCATGYFSFGHEIAHLMGAKHDRGTHNACDSSNDNFGYREPTGMFRTITAYSCKTGQCDGNTKEGTCTRIQRFSNPDKSYNGMPLGEEGKSNNARVLNEKAVQFSNYFDRPAAEVSTTTEAPTTTTTSTTTTQSSCSGSMTWSKKNALDISLKALLDNNLLSQYHYDKAKRHNKQMYNNFKNKKDYPTAIKKIESVIWRIKNKAKTSSIKTTALDQANCIKDLLETY